MTNNFDIRQNIMAALAAVAVSTACVVGTVGPVNANYTGQPTRLAEVGTNVQPALFERA